MFSNYTFSNLNFLYSFLFFRIYFFRNVFLKIENDFYILSLSLSPLNVTYLGSEVDRGDYAQIGVARR